MFWCHYAFVNLGDMNSFITKKASGSKEKKKSLDCNLWNDAYATKCSLFMQLCDSGMYQQSQLLKS